MTGLVIKSPWIELILSGKKTWEIRGSRTKPRERIALIKSKSGTIVGGCDVVDCVGPLTLDQLRASEQKHCIPLQQLDELPYPQTFAWAIKNAKPLPTPTAYTHPPGAVIWVTLNEQNVSQFARLSGEIGMPTNAASDASKIAVEPASSKPPLVANPRRAEQKRSATPPAKGDGELCGSFSIELTDGSEVVPCRIRDRQTGATAFKVSKRGNTSNNAILVTDEAKLRHYVEELGFRVRCKSRDGTRSGLFTSRSPNRIKDVQ